MSVGMYASLSLVSNIPSTDIPCSGMPQSPAQGSFTPANTYYHSEVVTYHHV